MNWPWRRAVAGVPEPRLAAEEARLAARRDALIEKLAMRIVAKRLETPAVFFLEMHRPLTFLVGQSALVAAPVLSPFVHPRDVEDFARILEDRSNLDRLIARIEDLADARDARRAASKAN